VGSLKPNDLGLFDMLGNVNEWCGIAAFPTSKAAADRPFDDVESPYPIVAVGNRLQRGAAFVERPENFRSAWRGGSPANVTINYFGFRPVRTLRRDDPPR
jgi:formylglycine-generating enzyme required for sulfatase activity